MQIIYFALQIIYVTDLTFKFKYIGTNGMFLDLRAQKVHKSMFVGKIWLRRNMWPLPFEISRPLPFKISQRENKFQSIKES